MPKGIYDRAASAWRPTVKRRYPDSLVAKVRELYAGGKTMREVADEIGCTVKVLQRLMPAHGIERRKATPRNQTGEKNSRWKGDFAGYSAFHLRVYMARGKASKCSRCGAGSVFDWANLTGRYEDVSDYAEMCRSCHRKYDNARRTKGGKCG